MPVSLGSLRGEVASAQRLVSFLLRLTHFLFTRKETTGSPTFPCYPLVACPALRPRWCFRHSPLRTKSYCLPQWKLCRLSHLPLVVILSDHKIMNFRGSITRPASSLHPASYPPLLMVHAGSLLSCWLGFAEVGLGVNFSHWVTKTSFGLALPLVMGFRGAIPFLIWNSRIVGFLFVSLRDFVERSHLSAKQTIHEVTRIATK